VVLILAKSCREGSPKNVEPVPRLLLPLLDHLYLLHYKPLPTALLDTHRLTCGICTLILSSRLFTLIIWCYLLLLWLLALQNFLLVLLATLVKYVNANAKMQN